MLVKRLVLYLYLYYTLNIREKHMNKLNIQKASDLKRAFNLNLTISEVRDGEIIWLGNYKDLNNFLNK